MNLFENNIFVEERGDEIQINISPEGENSGSLPHAIVGFKKIFPDFENYPGI